MTQHKIRWSIRRTADGWEGEATLALSAGAGAAVTARARAGTRADAAARTLAALDAVTRSPLVAAMLPPGAAPALRAARAVASSVARLFRRRRGARVSGGAVRTITRAEVARALARRGLPRPLVRLGAACAG
jgi:hypothetical protein